MKQVLIGFVALGLMALIALFVVAVDDYLSKPVVYYDEDASGQQVCRMVETSKGDLPCTAFSDVELATFEWQPALTSR